MPKPTGTQHHCPKLSKGNCRNTRSTGGTPYCSKHQVICYCKTEQKHLITEDCPKCRGHMTQPERFAEDDRKAEAARAEAARAEAESDESKKPMTKKPTIKRR